MRLLVIGGHFSPALGLIEALPDNVQVLYAGRKYALEGNKSYSLEYQAITARNIQFAHITTGRLQRKLTKHTLPSLLKLPSGFIQAFHIIKNFQPTVIIGFGGYVQVPICVVGYLLRIPIVIHEQTFEIGLANKMIAPFAKKVCISWGTSSKFFPRNKIVLTGNPAVSAIIAGSSGVQVHNETKQERNATFDSSVSFAPFVTKKTASLLNKLTLIVIVGGSQGSHAINLLVEQCLEQLVKHYIVFHQTGDANEFGDYDRLQKKKEKLDSSLQKKYTLIKFIDPAKIMNIFKSADLVISRAGVNTITTLLILNKPSLLIPLPVSQHSEQQKNAAFLKEHNLAEVLSQNEITPEKFLSTIHAMIKNKAEYQDKKHTVEINIHKDAAEKIIEILSYVEKSTS